MITGEHGAAGMAYRELKRRIIGCVFAPGEKLSEMRLVTELGVGRSPLRTALARLRSEGWVEVSPQSGTYVRGLTSQEIAEVVEMRLVLESHMAGVAALRISDAELAELGRAFEAFGSRVGERGADEYLDLDMKLHMAVYRAAGNALITRTLLDLLDKIVWIRRSSRSDASRLEMAYQETRRIFDALSRRDAASARRAMRAHILGVRRYRLRARPRAGEPASDPDASRISG